MQRTVLYSGVFLGAEVLTSAWQNPAAERFASEDIWQAVDTFLNEADDAVPDVAFRDVMNTISIVRDDKGRLSLMTGVLVHLSEVDACLSAFALALAALKELSTSAPRGSLAAGPEVEVVALQGDFFRILLYEPIGTVNGQAKQTEGLRLAA